jgi:hypothetical protein
MRRWHWISAGVCLAAVLLFSVTGITLNHAASISSSPAVTSLDATLPAALLDEIATAEHGPAAPLPLTARIWLRGELGVEVGGRPAEWSPSEIYVSMPEPGADAWLAIERDTGAVHYEHTDRGWISFFNDVHKGRHTGAAWNVLIDVVAISCVVFSLTGLVLLQAAARQRKSTWPLVGGGAAVIALLLVFLH